ncbi:MAG: DUF1573 domain-containing protein [Candidatus Hydrogenedentes bacterium]|nr:DUF1573 domain-containing protein [Candidatus Hydrogenedentota bacterium]
MARTVNAWVLVISMSVWGVVGSIDVAAQPAIHCFQSTYDFGELYSDELVSHQFVLQNSGYDVLEILQINQHCSCATAELSTRLIAPGESALLTALLDLHGRSGDQRVKYSVQTNDPKMPHLELALVGRVTPLLSLDAPELDFGTVRHGENRAQNVILRAARSEIEIGVKDIHVPPSVPCRVTFSTLRTGAMEIVVEVESTRTCGYFGGEIEIHVDRPREQFVSLAVSGEVLHSVRVRPSTIRLCATRNAGGVSPPVFLRVEPGTIDRFSIVGITLPDCDVAWEVFPDGSGGYIVQLDKLPPAKALAGKAVVLEIDIDGEARISVPFEIASRDQ